MLNKKTLLISFSSLVMLSISSQAILINSFTAATNDRFANNSNFIADSYNLSGMGLTTNGRWATLVSENVFVSSNHYHPSNGQAISFYATNNAAGGSITRTVSSGQRIGDTDIWVGVLSTSVDSSYAFYDIGLAPNIAQNSFMTGRSASSNPTTTQDVAFGRNILDSLLTNQEVDDPSGGATGNAILAIYNNPLGEVDYEALVEGGDSGAPMFTVDSVSGELIIVGTNWFEGGGTFESSGFTNLSADRDAILSIISANAVPEPSSVVLISLASLMLISKRKR
jgi:hypothetical protein